MSIISEGKRPFLISIAVAAFSLVLSVWHGDNMMAGVSTTALIITVPAAIYCHVSTYKYSLIASAVLLICTILVILFVPDDALVRGEETEWIFVYASALLSGVALAPQVLILFLALAAVFDASFNWAAFMSLGWLAGTGMMLPKYMIFMILRGDKMNAGMTVNAIIVTDMFFGIIIFIVFSVALGYLFRKRRCLITYDGLKVMS